MTDHQTQGNKKYRPAKGLLQLTWVQVEMVDKLIAKVCEAGHGTVKITVERGLPLVIEEHRSYKLSPIRDGGC